MEVLNQTKRQMRIRALTRTKLAGRNRWLCPGETALVPLHAIRLVVEGGRV